LKTRLAAATLAAVFLPVQAIGATTSKVVDIPLVGGLTQRILHVRPDAPIATIIAIPGSNGILSIQNDGSMPSRAGECTPPARNRLAFADRRFALAFVDANSAGAVYGFSDISAVVSYVRSVDNVPVWIMGGSNSTGITVDLAVNLPDEVPAGMVLFSPNAGSVSIEGAMRRPGFVIYHAYDSGQSGAAVYDALTAATPRGVAVFTGGSNDGCGFHLFNGLDSEFVAKTADFMTQYNPAQQAAANYQGLWWRSPAGSENGWGVNVAHQGDTIFATWYTYGLDGAPMWLFSDARKTTGSTYTGQLYQARGAPFSAYDASRFMASVVGSLTLAFTDADNGSFTYTVNGTTQSKPVTKFVFQNPVPTCSAATSVSETNYTDLWWGSPGGSENGWGVNLVHQGDILFATWYTYAADGRALWMVMDSAAKIADRTYRGNVYRTTSGPFNAYDPARFSATPVGTGTFTFTDASNGSFSYTVDGVTQSKPITRYVFAAPPTSCN
jgi:hypothetical protein